MITLSMCMMVFGMIGFVLLVAKLHKSVSRGSAVFIFMSMLSFTFGALLFMKFIGGE